uniref:uncharacterized protein LOC120329811 n=1 Tax=Styela clava TaxID=7725 RepID=UPI0019399049|nr:uncharacterized protein LOC120329811 [Styela clava]
MHFSPFRFLLYLLGLGVQKSIAHMSFTNRLWFSDSVVKARFTIGNLLAGKEITYKIDMMKTGQDEVHSSMTNTFSFLPGPGNVNQGAQGCAAVIDRSNIDIVVLQK